jgi:hydrogenase expression/formation protein HypD
MREQYGFPATIMEVCGTHTMSVARFGLKSLLPPEVRLVSGPGCPVCVTDQRDIDSFLALGKVDGAILASFGDMIRVPGSFGSLDRLRADGADVRVVYSPLDAVDIAQRNADRQVVFFGVGFETTMPATALAITTAAQEGASNFSVLSVHKTMPAALRALLSGGEIAVSGLLLPGHVTTIIGARAFDFLADELGIPCAVTGFEPLDIMLGIESILHQVSGRKAFVANSYSRAVRSEANPRAAALLEEVFEECEAVWRGLGAISGSGVRIRQRYSGLDARHRFSEILAGLPAGAETVCRCGDVLRGLISPSECEHFATVCTPTDPMGPCMVSAEGACAAAYKYGGV